MARHRSAFLDEQQYLGFTHGSLRWRSHDGSRLYEWDEHHEHIEVYNRRGKHLAVLSPEGVVIDDADRGRTINV